MGHEHDRGVQGRRIPRVKGIHPLPPAKPGEGASLSSKTEASSDNGGHAFTLYAGMVVSRARPPADDAHRNRAAFHGISLQRAPSFSLPVR